MTGAPLPVLEEEGPSSLGALFGVLAEPGAWSVKRRSFGAARRQGTSQPRQGGRELRDPREGGSWVATRGQGEA